MVTRRHWPRSTSETTKATREKKKEKKEESERKKSSRFAASIVLGGLRNAPLLASN